MFPRDMICLRNISVDTLHKGDTKDDDDNVVPTGRNMTADSSNLRDTK